MMEEVSGEDTNGDSTFEFVGDSASIGNSQNGEAVSNLPPPISESNVAVPVPAMPSAPPMTIAAPMPITLPTVPTGSTQTIGNMPGAPICYAPLPSYDAMSVPSATVDLSGVPEPFGMPQLVPPSPDSAASGIWGWFKQSEILNKFAEKAKNSVDTMITTLDPGMKDYLYSGGDISILVANNSEWIISVVREAFQQVFGRATVEACAEPASSGAPQPVGFSAGIKNAEERCHLLRTSGVTQENQAVLAVQSILLEATPENWFEVTCLVLQHPVKHTFLQCYSQATPVPDEYVTRAQDATPADYPLRWSGLAVTLDQAAGSDQWEERLTGVSRKETVLLAAKSLAGIYKADL